jgi:primosomal protein N' (replication factor Y) (superfamily II helicase)
MFAEIVFPLPFRNVFTYSVPKELEPFAQTGVRAVVPFGKRTLTGFIINTSDKTDIKEKIKLVSDILDDKPIFDKKSLKFYEWVSDYYLSSLGEALKLGVPYGSDIESKRKLIIDKKLCEELFSKEKNKSSIRAKILKALSERDEISFTYLQSLVKKKNIYSQIKSLEVTGAITVLDEITETRVKAKTAKFIELNKSVGEIYASFPEIERKSPKQVKILLELISNKNKKYALADIIKKTDSSASSVNSLEEKGFIKIIEKQIERTYFEEFSERHESFELTAKQKEVIEEISKNFKPWKFAAYLLHGITGSGKTLVYTELIKKAVENNKSALFLVPEISLTPQITSRLFNNFGNLVTVIHSRMSIGERYDSWRKVLKGKSKIVIGARSALFAPLKNIGIIVVDEEHDSSYKQFESVPKYHARDSAIILARFHNCPVVLGSATPSIESMHNALTGKFQLLEMPERIDNAKLPEIELVNVAVERKNKRMENIFSKFLLDKIEDRLRKKEAIIILQNRRGFSTQVYCDDCSEIETCQNCSVPLIYHINKNVLQCHYCGFVKDVPHACTNCGSLSIKYFGTGTERVEDEIEYYFPNARVKRIDSDSITKKNSLSKILLKFSRGDIDILVGTQMVSKGLDFSRVTLVGVISAETTLWLPDFRADERTFQLLTQVAGRSGRSKVKGEVVIQTQNEKNFTLQKVVQNDYADFYKNEITGREQMGYPPFTRIGLIEAKDLDERRAKGAISDFYKELKAYEKYLKIMEPATAVLARLKGFYRFHILIKSSKEVDPGGAILRKAILDSFINFNKKSRFRDVKLTYDVDPQSIM